MCDMSDGTKAPNQVPLHPWEFPGQCWKRLHVDFAGPFLGHTFLIIIDTHSKWLEVCRMPNLTSQATVTRLKRLFAAYGLPEHIVTDNGTQFMSEEFRGIMQQNGIRHSTSTPGHPATNGLAERYVQTYKSGMKKRAHSTTDLEERISLFLMQYRTTPNFTTGQSPVDLFLNRHVRTRLDFLRPDVAVKVRRQQYMQKFYHDQRAVDRSFSEKETVYMRNTIGNRNKWIPGVVLQQTWPVSHKVQGRDTNDIFRRYGDRLKARVAEDELFKETDCPETGTMVQPSVPERDKQAMPEPAQENSRGSPVVVQSPFHSSRIRKSPKRFDLRYS